MLCCVSCLYILGPYIAGGVCTSQARLEGKTVIITGSNTGIGKETALNLAKRGARVIMACRNLQKAETALQEIVQKSGNENVVAKHLDLASLKSVREFSEDVNSNELRLDALINNAGVMCLSTLTRTEDGFEMQMGVNHLGHFLLTNLLLDLLKKSAPSRIVVVSSMGHWMFTKTAFNFENMNGEIAYDKFDAYGQSKLANILFARELARRLKGTGVTANSLHPGIVASELSRHLPMVMQGNNAIASWFLKTSEQGAQTSIHLAVSEELEGVTGLYFADCKELPTELTTKLLRNYGKSALNL
jgi:NAD(P)-dependent dehydrogenase (short-subunit alcohol dehydrogenase family)